MTVDKRIYFLGPGDYNLLKSLPPGTECFQGEIAASGHLVLPCCEYDLGAGNPSIDRGSLTLLSRGLPPPPDYEPLVQPGATTREASPPPSHPA